MTDIEKAASKWLPDIWQPGRKCKVSKDNKGEMAYAQKDGVLTCLIHYLPVGHDLPCPPATPELGFRLLEAMLRRLVSIHLHEGSYEEGDPVWCHLKQAFNNHSADVSDPELLSAIIKAAAALADKDQ